MKGKGKGKDVKEQKECPLQFPDFTPIEHSRICPRYTAVLQRSEEEGVGIEDLDTLQLELETLLVSVTKRQRQLEQEMQVLITWQDKKDKKPENSGKRTRPPEGKPCKKYKDNAGKAHVPTGRPKTKSSQVVEKDRENWIRKPSGQRTKLQEYEFIDSPHDTARVPKNDAPNRFWSFIETYCAEVSPEDIKVTLDDILKSHDEDGEFYKIPALGKHYSLKWAQEDLLEEQKEGAKIGDKRRGLSNSSLNSAEADRILKKVEKEYDSDETSPFGALTQRLVSCLIEENLMTSLDDTMGDVTTKDGSEGNGSPPSSKGNIMKSLNIGNTAQLERRIRRELEEQGILDINDIVENPDDEVLAELRKCQSDLKALTSHNISHVKRLIRLAKDELARQELKKKLQLADAEVMEAHRKISAARQKKKSPTKKEKDQAWKAVRERENILKQLDSIGQLP